MASRVVLGLLDFFIKTKVLIAVKEEKLWVWNEFQDRFEQRQHYSLSAWKMIFYSLRSNRNIITSP